MRAYTRAAGADLPPPRRARDRRDGRVHPEPPRPGGHRGRAGEGPRRQGARIGRRVRRHVGRPSRPRAGRDGGLRSRARRAAEPEGAHCARRSRSTPPSCSTCACRAGPSPRPGSGPTSGSRWPYLDSWLRGVGAAAIDNLMEDAATAEISRSQLWHWRTRGVALADGRVFDARPVRRDPRRGAGSARRGGGGAAVGGGGSARSARPRRRLRRVPDAARVLAPGIGPR